MLQTSLVKVSFQPDLRTNNLDFNSTSVFSEITPANHFNPQGALLNIVVVKVEVDIIKRFG